VGHTIDVVVTARRVRTTTVVSAVGKRGQVLRSGIRDRAPAPTDVSYCKT